MKANTNSENNGKSSYKTAFWIIVILLVIGGFYLFNFISTGAGYTSNTLPTKELRYPANKFMKISSSGYTDVFWQFEMTGSIYNSAPVTYQDAVIEINFYSKTSSLLGTKDYTIYNFLPRKQAQISTLRKMTKYYEKRIT